MLPHARRNWNDLSGTGKEQVKKSDLVVGWTRKNEKCTQGLDHVACGTSGPPQSLWTL